MKDTCQLALFCRGVTTTFEIEREFVEFTPKKDTSTGADILESVIKQITKTRQDLSRLSGVISDRAPALAGYKNGFATLLQNYIGVDQRLIKCHCIAHQDALCASSMNFLRTSWQ